jgi:hypothetical protein
MKKKCFDRIFISCSKSAYEQMKDFIERNKLGIGEVVYCLSKHSKFDNESLKILSSIHIVYYAEHALE